MAPLGSIRITSCTKSWYACGKGAVRRGEALLRGSAGD
jgi:hypothetical protein